MVLVLLVGLSCTVVAPRLTARSEAVVQLPDVCRDCIRGPWQFSRGAADPAVQTTAFETIAGSYDLVADSWTDVGGAVVMVNGATVLRLAGGPSRVARARVSLSGTTTLAVKFVRPGSVRLALHATAVTTLPSCGPASNRTLFDSPPVDPTLLQVVIPLGGRAPPNHTLPIHHINPTPVFDSSGAVSQVPISAPGLARVVAAVFNGVGSGGEPDYSVYFRPCSEVRLYLIHLNGLSPRLAALTGAPIGWGTFGEVLTAIDFSGGEAIGTARSFDIGLVDSRQPALGFVSRSWYEITGPVPAGYEQAIHDIAPERLFQFCALDYFTPSVAAPLAALLGEHDGTRRTAPPVCGEHMLDVAGTAQGGWFGIADAGTATFPPDGAFDESNDFSFAPHHVDPSVFQFAFSTEIIPPPDGFPGLITQVSYSPVQTSGFVNRAPSAVLRDTGVYCFEHLIYRGGPNIGRLLVQVQSAPAPDVEQILIRYQASLSTCGTGPWSIAGATTYRR
jgi:hypothetical protein